MRQFYRVFGKLLVLLFFVLSISFQPLSASSVFAAEEFSTSYDVSYDVGSDSITQVTQKITLTNLTSKYYASNFTLTIGSTTVSNVSASDEAGAMETKVESKDNKQGFSSNKTSITVKFNQQIAGADKKQTFTLKYTSKDFAEALGKTWEVNLPRIPETGNIDSYNLVLSVPVSFGDPTSIAPSPKSSTQSFDRQFFTFDKNQLQKSGVSVDFGTNQVFDFNLKYHLENNSLFPVLTSVVLPPDTNYQDSLISKISPEPENVTVDEDGNYLAWYRLPRRSKQDVTVTGSAKLYIVAKDKRPVGLSQGQIAALTKSDQYWEKDNPAVTAALSEIFKEGTPRTNREKARLIYSYVVNTLKYDTSRLNSDGIERLGAITALNNPASAVCMEFTDLFIALSRAVGIPARELDGFAYSQNSNLRPLSLLPNLLHAWPEYFDETLGWVMVDPTWENTSGGVDYFNKFDLNHLVLAVKGTSSKLPFTSDDVKVTLAQGDFIAKPQVEVTVDIPDTIWAGLPATLNVKVVNQGNSAQGSGKLVVTSGQLTVLGDQTVSLGSLPPFGSVSYKFNLRTPLSWQSFEDVIEINVAGQKITKKVWVKPLLISQPFPYLFAGLAVLIGLGYGSILGLHIYWKKSASKKRQS